MGGPLVLDRPVEIVPIVGPRLGGDRHIEAVLVGVGLQVRGVGVEHRAVDQPMGDRLLDDGLEDVLRHAPVLVPSPPVLAERRGVEHRVGQPQPKEPAIGDVDRDLVHRLALRADAEQVADEQRLEHQRRVERRATIVRAIEPRHPLVDERKVDYRIDLAKQVVPRNQTIERHHLDLGLRRLRILQQAHLSQKPPAFARGLSAV